MQVDYTAQRSLKAGHTAGLPYTINVNLSREDRRYQNIGPRQTALDGSTVTIVHRRQTVYQIATIFITDSSTPDNADMLEFLDSVVSGEVFETDVDGTLKEYILEGNTYRKNRTGTLDVFTYSFRMRALS